MAAQRDQSVVDLLSSPDPLNGSISSALYPSAHRVTRSQRSQRFMSLESSSPRKQTFELQVGDNQSPQKLFVTVETEGSEGDNVGRRLFTSPTPTTRRQRTTTTTKVPLRDDDAQSTATTPKRRGRPPKAAGTPKSTKTTKKRAATPIKRTPRRAKVTSAEDTASEASIKPTPRSSTRTKRTTKVGTELASDDNVPSLRQTSTAKRRGRGRRMSLMPEEVEELADAPMDDIEYQHHYDHTSDPGDIAMDRVTPTSVVDPDTVVAESEPDIWMATLSEQETPRALTHSKVSIQISSPPHSSADNRSESPQQQHSEVVEMEMGDEYSRGAPSDVSSEASAGAGGSISNDQDTVAQGEDFSMIFMTSLPSLQANLSAAQLDQQDFGEETSLIINKTLESYRQGAEKSDAIEADTSRVTLPLLPAAQSPEPVVSPRLSSPRRENQSPTWSRSPRRTKPLPLSRQLLSFKAKKMDESFSSVPSRVLAGATPGRQSPGRRSSGKFNDDESVMYEDSFSEIPDAVLEAATPRRPVTKYALEAEAARSSPQSLPASNASAMNAQSDPGRLLTPEETPSPSEQSSNATGDKAIPDPTTALASGSPSGSLGSSPHSLNDESSLKPDDATTLPASIEENVTPAAQQSSPNLPPLHDINVLKSLQDSIARNSSRPVLSPIVRAGMALQSVTSDASSPRSRQNSLGSPFRATNGNQPQSTNSKNGWTQPLSNLIQAGAQLFQPSSTGPPRQIIDDPFGPQTQKSNHSSFMQALTNSLRGSVAKPNLQSNGPSSTRGAPPDYDEMSWVADEYAQRAPSRDQSFGLSQPQSSSMNAVKGSMAAGQLASSDHGPDGTVETEEEQEEDQEEDQEVEEEDEEDIWALEAQRPTPRSSRQQPFGKKSTTALSRRGKIPSPWAKNKDLHVEPANVLAASQGNARSKPEASEVDEYSMLARGPNVSQKNFQINAKTPGRFDLSAFFSSPAPLPGMQGAQEVLNVKKRAVVQQQGNLPSSPEKQVSALQTNSMFPIIPQKDFRPVTRGRMDLFSPAAPQGTAANTSEIQESTQSTPEQVQLPSVAQKRNFTPRTRQMGQSLFRPASAGETAPTPARMQLTHADIQKWQETSAVSDESPEFMRPLLRPLPNRNLSPTKSCLRSPLKPHTPGRVVEFTSSVLSPILQAQARAERRLSAGSVGSASASQLNIASQEADKENEQSFGNEDISMTDAPEDVTPKKQDHRLSQTMWSRDHWLLLDEFIQLRRKGSFDFELSESFTSKSSRLLGRSVESHGQSLVLDQWHLDVVDAFKAEVGGFGEDDLAKRLFALIAGEELRKAGKRRTTRGPSVKFH